MNRCMCLIECGQERRGHGSLPERSYRMVYGEHGATQFVNHDVLQLGSVICAASAAGTMSHAT